MGDRLLRKLNTGESCVKGKGEHSNGTITCVLWGRALAEICAGAEGAAELSSVPAYSRKWRGSHFPALKTTYMFIRFSARKARVHRWYCD
jgi:hypothetical protein